MLWNRYGAVALGACACLAVAAGAACSSTYAAAEAPPVSTDEAGADAAVDSPIDHVVLEAGAPDAAPKFVELASGLVAPGGIASTDTTVYVAAKAGVVSVPMQGGMATTLFSGSAGSPLVLGTRLFWIDRSNGALVRSDLDGSPSVVRPVTFVPLTLAGAASQVVVTGTSSAASSDGVLHYLDFDLGDQTATALGAKPTDVAVDATAAYLTQPSFANVSKASAMVGLATLADSEPGCHLLATDGTGVYWTRPSAGVVRRSPSVGSTAASDLAAKEHLPSSIAADDTGVYWLTGDGKLRRKRADQELPPTTIAEGFASDWSTTSIRAIALTTTYIVWVTTDGRVLRAEK